jgi:hypothetical protein
VILTGLGSAVLAVLRVVIRCMGSAKDIGQRRINTLVAASSENSAKSEETNDLLNTDMRYRSLPVVQGMLIASCEKHGIHFIGKQLPATLEGVSLLHSASPSNL